MARTWCCKHCSEPLYDSFGNIHVSAVREVRGLEWGQAYVTDQGDELVYEDWECTDDSDYTEIKLTNFSCPNCGHQAETLAELFEVANTYWPNGKEVTVGDRVLIAANAEGMDGQHDSGVETEGKIESLDPDDDEYYIQVDWPVEGSDFPAGDWFQLEELTLISEPSENQLEIPVVKVEDIDPVQAFLNELGGPRA